MRNFGLDQTETWEQQQWRMFGYGHQALDPELADCVMEYHHRYRLDAQQRRQQVTAAKRAATKAGLQCWPLAIDPAGGPYAEAARRWAPVEQRIKRELGLGTKERLTLAFEDEDDSPVGWMLKDGVLLYSSEVKDLFSELDELGVSFDAYLSWRAKGWGEDNIFALLKLDADKQEEVLVVSEWVAHNQHYAREQLQDVSIKQMLEMSKLEPELRWSYLKGPKVLKAARENRRVCFGNLPNALKWQKLYGSPVHPSIFDVPLEGLKMSVLKSIAQELTVDMTHDRAVGDAGQVDGMTLPLVQLVRLFADVESIKRFVLKAGFAWNARGVHDAGQFRLPKQGFTPSKWAPLALKHPRVLRHASEFTRVEAAGGAMPQSAQEFLRRVRQLDYPDVLPGFEDLASICLDNNLSASTFSLHQEFWSKSVKLKTAEFCPDVRVYGEDIGLSQGWSFQKLPFDSQLGPLLGELTGCCQHLGGAGRACARHGVESPYSAFYVVRHHGKVIAQSWAWRSGSTLVFDSIESRNQDGTHDDVLALYESAAQAIVERNALGVTAVMVGYTSSGMTRPMTQRIEARFQAEAAEKAAKTAGKRNASRTKPEHGGGIPFWELNPHEACDYLDGHRQLLLAGKFVKASLPSVDDAYGKLMKKKTRQPRQVATFDDAGVQRTLYLYAQTLYGDRQWHPDIFTEAFGTTLPREALMELAEAF